jgi:hypothetical protein
MKMEIQPSKSTQTELREPVGDEAATIRRITTIDEIAIADEPGSWEALGFAVSSGVVQLGTVRIALLGRAAGQGILGWSLRGVSSTELDGLPTTISRRPPHPAAPEHPNGLGAIDHVVAMSPDLDRSMRVLESAGLDLRRIRERPTPAGAPRQAFFRLGKTIFEVIQEPAEVLERSGMPHGPARFWGLALLADDLDETVMRLGGRASEIRPAVQYGRRIATLKRSAGLTVPMAVMSPAVE